ncbi:hypothetical protein EJB05_40805, partial [Eragrostis curvula]
MFMKDELKTMQAFLTAAEAMKKKDLLLKVWAEQVRSLSYNIEDCFDEFMVHVGNPSLSQQLMKLKDRHWIAVQIRNLKSRVDEVSSRNTRYRLITTKATKIDDEAQFYMEDVRNHSATNIDEAELVGFSNLKKELLDMIMPNTVMIKLKSYAWLAWESTLVRKIYESKEGIANKFPSRAWITISQSFSRIEVLQDMIRKLFGDDSLKACLKKFVGKAVVHVQVEHLGKYIVEGLKEKRYFVVLDDVWKIDAWIWIRDICFPNINNRGSRILRLAPLENEHSIVLLVKNDEKLKIIVTKLVKKCGGLPLAIVTIGAMFATKHISEWDKLYEQLPSELDNNLSLKAIRSMVTLSYNKT